MKRLVYSLLVFALVAFIVISCGSGNKKAEEQGHVHGEETHIHSEETHAHGDETHSHENEGMVPHGQEDFVVSDTTQIDSLKQDSLNHDHDHDHDHDHSHQH